MKRAAILFLALAFMTSIGNGFAFGKAPKSRFITTNDGVKLEVLDWGGDGRPLIFLSGLGGTAHDFDDFAPKFAQSHHVYAITRRGFGGSGHPPPTAENYSADRLGDDVLGVMTALNLKAPALVGESIAGEELSSIGTRYPGRVAGLIYLDAAYAYAFYDKRHGDLTIDANYLRKTLSQPMRRPTLDEYRHFLHDLTTGDLPQIERDSRDGLALVAGEPNAALPPDSPEMRANGAVSLGEQRFGSVHVPMLAIYALPHRCEPDCGKPGVKFKEARDETQAAFVASINPQARVIRIPYASHAVYQSNAQDIFREMQEFLRGLG